jgi:cobalt-zinc-cadmium resistance protein CzcA
LNISTTDVLRLENNNGIAGGAYIEKSESKLFIRAEGK